MNEEAYIKKIAKLESLNDQLQTEFDRLHTLLKKVGFEDGIATLKEAAKEMLDRKKDTK